jgi:hypothetical protein
MLYYLKNSIIKAEIIIIKIIYLLRSLKNMLYILLNNNIKNYFAPNLSIKNIIMIDPTKIKYRNSIPMKFRRKSTPFIFDFDWDKDNLLLEDFEKQNYKYISCRELFIDGVKIENCKEFLYLKNKVKELGEYRNCKNENDIVLYFKNLFRLFESINKNGVNYRFQNNIECMIDRNSNLVKIGGGNHRLSISRILKLKRIPVEIRIIHSNFHEKRLGKNIRIKDVNSFIRKIELNYQ